MADKTGIEWTDATWNPIRGCSRVSEGCRHCYAEGVAYRFSGPGQPYEGLVRIGADGERRPEWSGTIRFVEEHLLDPLRWKTPRRIFVNSMSDLFHPGVTDEILDRIFAVMALCPQHTFQVLTKRPERMLAYLRDQGARARISAAVDEIWESAVALGRHAAYNVLNDEAWPLPNVWLGVSVEDQKAADERIPLLLRTPAAVRFISAEPLLGPVNLHAHLENDVTFAAEGYAGSPNYRAEYVVRPSKLHWVIVGGESGPGARPMHPDWARGLRDQCVAAGVPFFFKQWGEWGYAGHLEADVRFGGGTAYNSLFGGRCSGQLIKRHTARRLAIERRDGSPTLVMDRVGKKAAGDLLDGRQWREFPGARV